MTASEAPGSEAARRLLGRLQFVLDNMREVAASLDDPSPPTLSVVRVRIERWVQSLESITGQGEKLAPSPRQALYEAALSGENVTADAAILSLHDLTQLAVLLQPGATLTIINGSYLSPIERASITSTKPGQVSF